MMDFLVSTISPSFLCPFLWNLATFCGFSNPFSLLPFPLETRKRVQVLNSTGLDILSTQYWMSECVWQSQEKISRPTKGTKSGFDNETVSRQKKGGTEIYKQNHARGSLKQAMCRIA